MSDNRNIADPYSPEGRSTFFMSQRVALHMGHYDPQDEDLHPQYKATNSSADLSETQFFGFSIPEERIHSLVYTWCHPNLNAMSSGVAVGQGKHIVTQGMEMLDFRTRLSMDELGGTLLKYKTSGGYEVEAIEPGKRFRTTYLDKERGNALEVMHTAVHEPCVWSSNLHFEQVMKTEGEVTLRGRRYEIDGWHVRDRSWGENRGIAPMHTPPVTWISGVFDDGFAFHITATDSADLGPIWKDQFTLAPEDNLRFGWVIVDGRQSAVQSVRKLTHYDADLFPKVVELEFTDAEGRSFSIKGKIISGFAFSPWHNARWPICLTEWSRRDSGAYGYGEVQDGQWGDFLNAMR